MKLLALFLVFAIAFCQEPDPGTLCDVCVYAVGFVEKFVAENKTETEIENLIEKVCALLPNPYKDECDQIVEEYLPFIINFVEEELPAKKVCQLLDLCPKEEEETPMTTAGVCDMCKYVVNLIDGFLKENKTEPEIEALVEKFCAILPTTYKTECDKLVEQYLPLIITWVESETPTQICQMIDLCPKSNGLDACSICEYLVKMIEKYLADNKTEEEIMKELTEACKLLPKSYQSLCTTIVDQYIPTLIDYIEQSLPPKVACTYIGFCSTVHSATERGRVTQL